LDSTGIKQAKEDNPTAGFLPDEDRKVVVGEIT
jgi:hypothetical protein